MRRKKDGITSPSCRTEEADRSARAGGGRRGALILKSMPITRADWSGGGAIFAPGRRYFRSGTVVDLKIRGGRVEARVQGSRKVPYKVDIRISPLSEEKCQEIIARCGRKIQTIDKLINGEFPDELRDLFTGENGLFPSPREISFNCTCPDWALMCKHVAAAMYGIGVRFDENPFYFFHLRGIDVDRFIDVALENKVESMLRNAEQPSERILRETDLTGLFGVL